MFLIKERWYKPKTMKQVGKLLSNLNYEEKIIFTAIRFGGSFVYGRN